MGDVLIYSVDLKDPVAHASLTYSIPPKNLLKKQKFCYVFIKLNIGDLDELCGNRNKWSDFYNQIK